MTVLEATFNLLQSEFIIMCRSCSLAADLATKLTIACITDLLVATVTTSTGLD